MYWDSDMHDSMAMRMTRLGQPCRYDGEFMRGGPSDTTGLCIPFAIGPGYQGIGQAIMRTRRIMPPLWLGGRSQHAHAAWVPAGDQAHPLTLMPSLSLTLCWRWR